MPNNRRRKTRKSTLIRDTISNKNFIIISSILLVDSSTKFLKFSTASDTSKYE